MKCPYNPILSQVNQYRYEYNENQEVDFQEHKLYQVNNSADCLKEECAMWQDGKCVRKQE